MTIMQNTNARQKNLVKVRRGSKIVAWLLVFGGAVLFIMGLVQQVLPQVTNGIFLIIASLPFFVLVKLTEKKLKEMGV
jgi:uncharacterized membrane protein YiaA